MQTFRTLGQEVESNDINKLPGLTELSQGARASVQEAYNAAFTARQHLGMKLAQGAAYATAKAVMEQILTEARCRTCGRPMKEVRNGNVTHKFCPTCNPKSMGYGDSKRRMAEDEANSAERTRGQKEAFLHEKGYRHQGNGVWKHPKTGDTTTITYPKLKEDDSGSIQRQTVIKKDAEEEQPNPTKVGSWGKSPAYPPGSEPGAPLDAETGSAAILKKNHKDKGEPAGESVTEVEELVPGHLPVGDTRHMGAAWAALHGGYRGNKYEGPDKAEAKAKLSHMYKEKGLKTPAQESHQMTEEESQIFENSVADALRTAKKQGYNLNGEPKQGALGTTYKMAHPSGHSLQVHSDHNGVNWWHTHRNGSKKAGDDPNTLTAHLNDVDESEIMENTIGFCGRSKMKEKIVEQLFEDIFSEKHIGFSNLVHKLEAQGKSASYAGAIAKKVGDEKYGAKAMKHAAKTHTPLGEDEHGNKPTTIDTKHPSYRAGWKYGERLASSGEGEYDPTSYIHNASVDHIKASDKKKPMNLQTELDKQRQFKMGAHNSHRHTTGSRTQVTTLGETESSKQIQTKNFQEKCDYCGKKHDVGPCPAMQESEWKVDSPAYPGHTPDAPPAYECGGDWGEGPAPDAKSLLKKNHEDKGEPVAESEWGEPEEHEPSATYESEIQEDVDPDWHNHVKHGDKITIRVHNGIGRNGPEYKEKTGKAMIHNREQGGWALNMGGKHGTPGFAHAGNLVKHHKSKVHEEVELTEKKDAPICFCGHSATVHTATGCRSCKSEGHVNPQMAAHQFRRNSSVKMEETELTETKQYTHKIWTGPVMTHDKDFMKNLHHHYPNSKAGTEHIYVHTDHSAQHVADTMKHKMGLSGFKAHEFQTKTHPEGVKTEAVENQIDQTLQAAVDWLANRVNVRGITESAMPHQEVRIKDKFSPALAEASTLKYANEVKPEERHPWHEDAVKAGLKHDSTWKKGATTIHTYSPDHHWKSGAQLVTTTHKGKPDKHSWRAGAFDKGGDDLKSLHSHINAGVQYHDSMMAHHKAGTGPFAPGK